MGAVRDGKREDASGEEIVVALVQEHASSLLALARRHSLCADDASDAYQRALEILLRRVDSLEPATTLNWLRTVLRHEAYAVRAQRQAAIGRAEPELDAEPAPLPDDDERILRFDRLTRAAEALQRLKPHEVHALLLKAEGHSYEEICSLTGWSYTKVNRLLTEGRRTFRRRYAVIESGEECERWAPVLSAVADGEATPAELVAVRPHLRACPGCRATVRAYHEAPREVAAVLPAGLLVGPAAAGAAGSGRLHGVAQALHRVHDAILGASPAKLSAAIDLTASGKVAAVAATTVALAGGGFAISGELEGPAKRPARAHRVALHRTPAHRPRSAPLVASDDRAPLPPADAHLTPAPARHPVAVQHTPPPSPPSAAPSVPASSPAPPPAPVREFSPETSSSASYPRARAASAPSSARAPSRPPSGASAGTSPGEFTP